MSMKIKCEGVELTDAIMEVINKDLQKIESFKVELKDINFLLKKDDAAYLIEIMINTDRFAKISASDANTNLLEAIHGAFAKFETQLVRAKEKQTSHRG